METKACTKCDNIYEATSEFFHRSKRHASGLLNTCKICCNEYLSVYRKSPHVKEKEYAHRNLPHVKERIAANRKQPEAIAIAKERSRKWVEDNPEKYADWYVKYRNKNKATINNNKRERYRNDPEYRARVIKAGSATGIKARATLTDAAIKKGLCNNKSNLLAKDIPPEMVVTRRLTIQIKREIKKQENGIR